VTVTEAAKLDVMVPAPLIVAVVEAHVEQAKVMEPVLELQEENA